MKIKSLVDFFKIDIWHVQLATLPKWQAYLYRFLRIVLLTIQGFTKSQIQQGASALTYYSLLAVVPIIALLIGIARGFQFERNLEEWLISHFAEQKQVIQQIFKFATASLEQARGGLIAGIGIAILLWAAIKILANIEIVMNQIWEVKKGRTLDRQFTDYLAMLFLAPIILFLASGLTGYLSTFVSGLHKGQILEHFATVLIALFSVVSFLLISLLFTFIYIFMPNTRVRLMPALIAGLVTGVIYQFLQWLYFYFQIGVSSYNAIYGTFAALPLFLVWLHLSWVIILIGAKLTFALQNVDAYEFIVEDVEISQKIKTICALRIAHLCIKDLVNEAPPPTMVEISNALSIPHVLTHELTYQLVNAGVLAEIKRADLEEAYQPAKSLDTLTIKRVIDLLNNKGSSIPLPSTQEVISLLKNLDEFNSSIEKSAGNVLLKDI